MNFKLKRLDEPVLAFLGLNNSLGVFWTLVQVLLPTNLVQLTTSGSLLLLSKRVHPVGKSTRIHAYALDQG
jgi:hypothetical protein